MKFKPILGSDLSGHIGGVVASHNTYGPYFRQRVRPVNVRSGPQRAQRTSLARVSQSWRGLDPTVRLAWAAATIVKTSRKGDRVNLSGQAAYQFVNTIRDRLGVPYVTSPPTSTTTASITAPSINFTSATVLSVTFAADGWNDTDGGVIVSAGLLTSSGKSFAIANRAGGQFVDPGTAATTLTLPFAVPIGGRVRLTYHATNPDGRISEYLDQDVTNPSFPPPPVTTRHLVSVTVIDATTALWTYDGVITVTPGADVNLLVGAGSATAVAQGGPNSAIASYTGPIAAGDPWGTPSQPTTISQPIENPKTGTTV